MPYQDKRPNFGDNIFLAPNASIIGEIELGHHVSVWFGAVIRGDIAPVKVGKGTNIQDLCVLHVGNDDPCIVGCDVVVGHQVTLHGCTVEDNCLIGMGAIVLNRSVIGQGSVIGAGALVTQGTEIPPHSLVYGSPASVIRELTPREREEHRQYAPKYVKIVQHYRDQFS